MLGYLKSCVLYQSPEVGLLLNLKFWQLFVGNKIYLWHRTNDTGKLSNKAK